VVTVRPEQPEDLHKLQKLLRDYGRGDDAWHLEYPQRYFSIFVAVDDSTGVVGIVEGLFDAEYDERFPAAASSGSQAWASLVLVEPTERRAGVGQALLARFAREAQHRGCTFLAAKVDDTTDPSGRRAFFTHCGLYPLNPDQDDLIVGAALTDIVAACG
jgi:GNAT superfamily N-acetyltransferase